MQVFGLGGDGRIGSLSQTSLALQRRTGKFGLARFGCRPAWPFVGGGRLTNCRNAVPDAERKKSRAASVSSARLSRSRVAPWVFGRETTEKRQRRWVGWLHGWLAGSRTARFQTCVGAALSASPTNSEQILQAAHHASPAAAQLNRCSSTPLPLSSPLVRRRLHHRSSLIALPRLGHSSSSSSTTYAPIPHPPRIPFVVSPAIIPVGHRSVVLKGPANDAPARPKGI